jgi:hypothetical protein
MDELLYHEDMMWLQRSRIAWLWEGNQNTQYFYRQAMWRAQKNKITKLKNQNNEWCEDPKVLQTMAVDFFRDLYSADSNVDPSKLIELMNTKITEDMNEALCRSFSVEEISDALFQMGPLKVPGPDGFPACFYQRHWEVLENDVVAPVQKFFEDGILPSGINDTTTVLILKGSNPEELKDFRPINLCNVIYKIISKCLVNRL